MSIGLNDIATALKLAWDIYEKGFSKTQNAQTEYAAFGVDIREFKENLESIQKAIENATASRRSFTFDRTQQWDLSSLNRILGDFHKTIEECDTLLKDSSKFKRDNAGFVRNIQWNLMVAEQVRRLRERVAFHSVKMLKIMKPLEIKLFSDLQQEVLNVRLDIADLGDNIFRRFDRLEGILVKDVALETAKITMPVAEHLPGVPDYLCQRFDGAAATKVKNEPFPLGDGVDALAFHFDKSTVKFRPTSPLIVTPDPLQYLSLMKCIWILKQIKSNPLYLRAIGSDKLWQVYLKEFELNLIQESKRFTSVVHPLQEPSQQDILLLPINDFSIFVIPASSAIKPSLLDPRPGEEKIIAMSLQDLSDSRKQDIIVFRRSESRVRIVTVTSSTIENDREIEGPEVDLEQASLIPFYASPETKSGIYNIGWKNNLADYDSYGMSFRSQGDMLKFQQGITNFQVVHSRPGLLSARAKTSGPFNGPKQLATQGMVQIWIFKPLPPLDPPSPNGTIRKSSTGLSTGSFGTKYATSLNPSSNITTSSAGSLIRKPEVPMLVIFTEVEIDGAKAPGFVALPIDKKTRIEKASCDCKRKDNACRRVVIESKESLDLKHYTFKGQPDRWNLAALRHPGHVNSGSNLEVLRGLGFLSLDFSTVEERVRFVTRFEESSDLYRRRLSSFNMDLANITRFHVGE